MKRVLFSLCMIMVFSLAGCKKEEVVYNQEENVGEEQNGEAMSGSLHEAIGVEDTWTETISVDLGMIDRIEIDATVNMPDINSVKVLSARKRILDEEEKKRIIESLSEGEVYVYDDLPKPEWQKYIEKQNQKIENINNNTDISETEKEEIMVEEYEYLEYLNKKYADAPDDWVLVKDDFKEDSYKIKYNNTDYVVHMKAKEEYQDSVIDLYPLSYENIYPNDYVRDIYPEINGEYGTFDNKCTLSKEQAEKMAVDFIKNLGFGDFTAVKTKDLECLNDNGNFHDGCEVTLYRCVDGVNVDGDDYDHVAHFFIFDSEEEAGSFYNYRFEVIQVNVNSQGAFSLCYNYPLIIEEVEAENVQILDFEVVKEKLLDVVLSHTYDGKNVPVVKYNNVDFMYYRCKGDESGNYRIVPAWRIAYIPAGSENPERVHFINAIDGSYIDVGKDLYH